MYLNSSNCFSMASLGSHSRSDDYLGKIQEGLQIEKKWQNVNSGYKIFYSFKKLEEDYDYGFDQCTTRMYVEYISADYPFYNLIGKSKILEDSKLFEAILCSRIIENAAQYDSSHHLYNEELVWVRDKYYYLVYGGSIIYYMDCQDFEEIRKYTEKIWETLRKNVLSNLKLAFGIESDPDQSKSSSQSSQGATPTPSVTDAVRTLILDELNSINPDPLLRRQFEFDMKVLTDKDTHFWRDRLELVRICSRSATSSEKSLIQSISDLKKIVEQNESYLASIVDSKNTTSRDQPETVSKYERLVENNDKQLAILTDTLAKLAQLVEGQAASRGTEDMAYGDKLQPLVDIAPTVEELKKYSETGFLARRTHTPTGRDGSSSCVDQEASQSAEPEDTERTEKLEDSTAPKATEPTESSANWELDEEILQKISRATSFLADIIRENRPNFPQTIMPSNNSSLLHFDLVDKICSYAKNVFSFSTSHGLDLELPYNSERLRSKIRGGVSAVLNLIKCQQAMSHFLYWQMVDIECGVNGLHRDFPLQLVVFHQLARILEENLEPSSKEIKDCLAKLESYAKEWNIDLPK